MGLFNIFQSKSAPTAVGEEDPKAELDLFLRRLSPRERGRFDTAFSLHGGSIKNLDHLKERFDKIEKHLKFARGKSSSAAEGLRAARWARDHADHIVSLAAHLQSIEMRKHDKDLARDSFAVRRYAGHAKEQAESLIKQLQPLIR